MPSNDSPCSAATSAAAWLAAAMLAAFSVSASALPPQETRTNFYATPAKKKIVGSLVLQCNGRELRRGQETDFAVTRTVRRCTGPVVPPTKPPCEMKPGGCANLPGG